MAGLPTNVSSIATGNDHACALTTDGAVWCWGTNTAGQLGDGTTIPRVSAEPISGLTSGVVAISSGHGESCVLKADGSLWCWGFNYAGEIGDGTVTTRTTPVPVFGISSGVAAVSVGSARTCAVKTDGSAWCWGHNAIGALGDGTTEPSLVPVRVKLGIHATAVAAGTEHACAIVSDGTVWCWGDDRFGELGPAAASCDAARCPNPTPAPVSGLPSNIVAVTAGYFWTCALERNGNVWCWGANDAGQLGDGRRSGRSMPQRVLPCGE